MRIGKRTMESLMQRWAEGAPADAAASRAVMWDDELPGFGVRRQKDRSASYVLKYRIKGTGAQRWVVLGAWPTVHPDEAREEARAIKAAAALGRDLVAEDRAKAEAEAAERNRTGTPVAEMLDAWRAAVTADIERLRVAGRPATHQREMLRLERRHIRPAVAGQDMATFDPARFQSVIDAATGHSAARGLTTLLSRIARFSRSWCLERGIVADWRRTYDVPHARPPSRSTRFTLTEAAQLWLAAGDLGRRGALIRFMLLTGCRRSEAVRLRMDHLRLDDAVLGPHVEIEAAIVKHRRLTRLPLAEPAAALLRWLPQRESRRVGPAVLVFAGRGNREVGGWSLLLRDLLGRAGLAGGHLHDIRRTVVSTLADHGFEPAVVDRLLNHAASATMSGVMAVYQRSELWGQQRKAVDAWAGLLMGEAGRLRGRPIEAPAWGLEEPFRDAVVRRPKPPAAAVKRAGKGAGARGRVVVSPAP